MIDVSQISFGSLSHEVPTVNLWTIHFVVYNLRGGFWGSVTPATEQKDFRTQSTYIRCFDPKRICSRGGATNSKSRALLEHWSATIGAL